MYMYVLIICSHSRSKRTSLLIYFDAHFYCQSIQNISQAQSSTPRSRNYQSPRRIPCKAVRTRITYKAFHKQCREEAHWLVLSQFGPHSSCVPWGRYHLYSPCMQVHTTRRQTRKICQLLCIFCSRLTFEFLYDGLIYRPRPRPGKTPPGRLYLHSSR